MSKFSHRHQLKKDKMPLILAGAGLLALIIFLVVVFPNDRETETQIEKRTEQTEAGSGETAERLARLEARHRALEQMMVRFEELDKSLSSRMDHIEKVLESLQKKVAVSAPTVSQPARAPEKRTRTTVRYHHVRDEDTLYRISRKYGLTVEALLRMNNLTPDALIHPGQKLIVGPAK
ncbi:LysM domain-containing protein [Desulfobacterales bacterium HSG2]|nr:LysM domain-containing protein [Desulfobacterales bacterium HSG2]